MLHLKGTAISQVSVTSHTTFSACPIVGDVRTFLEPDCSRDATQKVGGLGDWRGARADAHVDQMAALQVLE